MGADFNEVSAADTWSQSTKRGTLSDPVVQLRAEAEKEEVEENYGGLVITALGFALTSFLAP